MFKKARERVILARLVGLMPLNSLRCFLYRYLFGYQIDDSFISRTAVLAVDSLDLSGCTITGRNRFVGPMNVTIKEGAFIEPDNNFICGWWTAEERFADTGYERELIIGANTLITSHHYFDVAGSFKLGDRSWIGGRYSQFWTHGAGSKNRTTSIGQDCYIGSASMFSPGASVGNNCLVALGSVVTRTFDETNIVLGGNPAKVLKQNYDWKKKVHLKCNCNHPQK